MKGDELEIGDYVIPTMPGIMELGDPPYKIIEVDDGMYTIVQKMGSHNPKNTLKRENGLQILYKANQNTILYAVK